MTIATRRANGLGFWIWRAARSLIRKALVRTPQDARLHHLLGLSELRLGSDQEALDSLERARKAGAEGLDFDFDRRSSRGYIANRGLSRPKSSAKNRSGFGGGSAEASLN